MARPHFGKERPVSATKAAGDWDRARAGGLCGSGASGAGDDTKPVLGDGLSAAFWGRNHCRDDADYLEHRFCTPCTGKTSAIRAPSGTGVRSYQPDLWVGGGVPDSLLARIPHQPPAVDAAIRISSRRNKRNLKNTGASDCVLACLNGRAGT